MRIAVLHHPADDYAGEVVGAAVLRSFSAAQVVRLTYGQLGGVPDAAVLINPGDDQARLAAALRESGRKGLVLGRPAEAVAGVLGLTVRPLPAEAAEWARVVQDPSRPHDAAPVSVVYAAETPPGAGCPLPERQLCRYDFADEWNNLGYGRIAADGGPWALACLAEPAGAAPVAWLERTDSGGGCGGGRLGLYASLLDAPGGALLWFDRPVGPVDSLEWTVVERFFSDHRVGEMVCLPSLCEVPYGFDAAVAARLDCDEAVASARPLFELYRSRGRRLSLAAVTGLDMDASDLALLRDVVAAGGAVLSHSASHRPDWGGSRDSARSEALAARAWLEEHLPTAGPHVHVVSPFHGNPLFAVQGLEDAGIEGFVGGSIRADAEFLVGRAGRVPFARRMVTHSQPCMLHGDCHRRYGGSIGPYARAASVWASAGSIFGYCDHPFSPRYAYGWGSEDERCRAHAELLEAIEGLGRVWWCGTAECLAVAVRMSRSSVSLDDAGGLAASCPASAGLPPAAVRLHGTVREVRADG